MDEVLFRKKEVFFEIEKQQSYNGYCLDRTQIPRCWKEASLLSGMNTRESEIKELIRRALWPTPFRERDPYCSVRFHIKLPEIELRLWKQSPACSSWAAERVRSRVKWLCVSQTDSIFIFYYSWLPRLYIRWKPGESPSGLSLSERNRLGECNLNSWCLY